jgi:hypothetical protein
MKKQTIMLSFLLHSSLLTAGGNILPPVVSPIVSPISINENNTYRPSISNIALHNTPKKQEIYIDRKSQLIWQDEAYTDEEEGAYKREYSIQKAGNFTHAHQYCQSLEYAKYTHWRLPSADELSQVHDRVGGVFIHTRDNDFWSSTPATRNKYYVVFPADAIRYARSPRQSNFIRCVRDFSN